MKFLWFAVLKFAINNRSVGKEMTVKFRHSLISYLYVDNSSDKRTMR